MATLSQITNAYADARGRSFDFGVIQRLKFAIKACRATLIRQDYERNIANKHMQQYYIAELIKVDSIDNCILSIDCNILRTKDKVEKPVRVKSHAAFQYVGVADLANPERFAESTISDLEYISHNKYTKNVTRYIYVNDYIYIVTGKHYKWIMINDVFADPEAVMNKCAENCGDDNTEFPLSEDMIPTVYKMLDELNILADNTSDSIKLDTEYETDGK